MKMKPDLGGFGSGILEAKLLKGYEKGLGGLGSCQRFISLGQNRLGSGG